MPQKRKKNEKPVAFKLKLHVSDYSKLYEKYMQTQYSTIQQLLKKIVQMPFCTQYYLRYPLESLLRGVCRKLLLNVYELIVFGYFLSIADWKLDSYIYGTLSDVFPNVIHVNEPTDPQKLKQLSIFLYFSAYSIKEFLNEDITIYREQMMKLFPQFQHIQNSWTSSQHTVGQILNPRLLNRFYMQAQKIICLPDYNFCVDKILQISPCYDIASKSQKKQMLNFGFMQQQVQNQDISGYVLGNHNQPNDFYYGQNYRNEQGNQMKIQDIDMNDFKEFDGDI